MKKHLLAGLALLGAGCATPNTAQAPAPAPAADHAASPIAAAPGTANTSNYQGMVNDLGRPEADRQLDPQRKPAEMLAFFGVRPGMKVADLGAGGGYTTELLARAVGPTGTVYAQNPGPFVKFAGKPLSERLARPGLERVVRLDREFDDPFPPEVKDLDLVVSHAVYHDAVWLKQDRNKMNQAVFAALKSGGHYVVIDSSARAGTGTTDSESLHRIDEQLVVSEVQKAGFKLENSGDFLRNPSDTRDWNVSPRAAAEKRGTGDRFALRFVKP